MSREPATRAEAIARPAPVALDYASLSAGRGSAIIWLVAFLFFPYGPFICLAFLHALRWRVAILLVIASVAIVNGLVYGLIQTNALPWQNWLVILLGASNYCFGILQYVIGERRQIWSIQGRRLWRGAAWFFGILLGMNIVTQVVLFIIRGR